MNNDPITGILFFQIMTMAIIVTIIIIETFQLAHEKQWTASATSILFWMVHSIIFYSVLMLYNCNVIHIADQTLLFTNWSSGLRLHGFLTIFFIELGKVLRWKLTQ